MKREELGTHFSYEFATDQEVYLASEADSVMDAIEARIKELEEDNKNYKKVLHENSMRGRIYFLDKAISERDERIKELEEVNDELEKVNEQASKDIAEQCKKIKELEADKLRQENYCESLVNENKRLNEIIISKDMVGADLVNENKALRHNLEDWKCENEALKARIKELEANQPKWVSVKDRLPETDNIVVFSNGNIVGFTNRSAMYLTCDGGWCCNDVVARVTHWMPLPKAPKSED